MPSMLTDLEKKVVAAVQGDIPICKHPYRELAEQIGISEEEFLTELKALDDRKLIRRFGATLRHQKSGYTANAMVAWIVDEDRVEAVGKIMAAFRQVSHCYRRDPAPDWPYNLYTMVHAMSEASCRETAAAMAAETDVATYTLLFSVREFKKTSMNYFSAE